MSYQAQFASKPVSHFPVCSDHVWGLVWLCWLLLYELDTRVILEERTSVENHAPLIGDSFSLLITVVGGLSSLWVASTLDKWSWVV